MALRRKIWRLADGEPVGQVLAGPQPLPLGPQAEHTILIMPVWAADGAIAVAIVPDDFTNQVAHNGVLLGAGLHPLPHAGQLDVGRETYWFSVEAAPEDDQFDPERHGGADQRCALTHARLTLDDPITICPGTPATACTALYKRSAWQTALAGPRPFRCLHCKFEPGAPAWRPKPPSTHDRLRQLLELILQEE